MGAVDLSMKTILICTLSFLHILHLHLIPFSRSYLEQSGIPVPEVITVVFPMHPTQQDGRSCGVICLVVSFLQTIPQLPSPICKFLSDFAVVGWYVWFFNNVTHWHVYLYVTIR